MREIKFRAWDEKSRIMKFDLMIYLGGLEPSVVEWDDFFDYPLMQFTGLKDKNGVEIYEGDIVKQGNLVAEVKWDAPEFHNLLFGVQEVIGNIYENPELLEN